MKSSEKLRIGVMFGGRSGEHAVSLMSARSVLSALDANRYEVTQIGISKSGFWYTGDDVLGAFEAGRLDGLDTVTIFPEPSYPGLRRIDPEDRGSLVTLFRELDIFFPVLHGTFGEDGTLQGVFEMAGAAYVGGGVLGSAVGMDKGVFKDVMRANSVPVLEATIIRRSASSAAWSRPWPQPIPILCFPTAAYPNMSRASSTLFPPRTLTALGQPVRTARRPRLPPR